MEKNTEAAIGGMATNNSSASLSGSTRQAAVPEIDRAGNLHTKLFEPLF